MHSHCHLELLTSTGEALSPYLQPLSCSFGHPFQNCYKFLPRKVHLQTVVCHRSCSSSPEVVQVTCSSIDEHNCGPNSPLGTSDLQPRHRALLVHSLLYPLSPSLNRAYLCVECSLHTSP
uniref:Uncharacterized protein n=1 Tax=Opuntia streptacantha TaxID=393608 RepID=A0A7C9B0B5_OPUST